MPMLSLFSGPIAAFAAITLLFGSAKILRQFERMPAVGAAERLSSLLARVADGPAARHATAAKPTLTATAGR